jgi:uncharacterized protein (DUF433 family)
MPVLRALADRRGRMAMRIEIPDELAAAVAEIAAKTGQDTDSLVAEMVTEAIKMRRVPGILFADGATGRRARIGGTGIEVFEVIDVYELFGRDREKVLQDLPQLEPHQVDAAIAYYEAYPDDITPRLRSEETDNEVMQALWAKYPQMRADWPGRRPGARIPTNEATRESA